MLSNSDASRTEAETIVRSLASPAADTARGHRSEIRQGTRFEFGRNWARFLKSLTQEQVEAAERSLQDFLGVDRLDGKSLLDIGNGSGLFSLAARRLGARVRSFDYDPHSVACARELRRRFFPEDQDWVIDEASVLDAAYLASLGQFDIVYSWGVLHHTGALHRALDNVKPLVPIGGTLFIAIYNDLGTETDVWEIRKRRYNALPRGLRLLYALRLIWTMEGPAAVAAARAGRLGEFIAGLRNYGRNSVRGMSRWHDYIDWIGGYPYERAKIHEIVDIYGQDGFRLERLLDRSAGIGCNQFVFKRIAPAGSYVESAIPGGHSMAWRFGARITGPFEQDANGDWTGLVPVPPERQPGAALYLIRDDRLAGPVDLTAGNRVRVAAAGEDPARLRGAALHVVMARQRRLVRPFVHTNGLMWRAPAPDLVDLADAADAPRRSPAFLFEDSVQLPWAHVRHGDIAADGQGRFSHWSGAFYFAASDSSDPNKNGRDYVALVAAEPLPPERSLARRHGLALTGPCEATPGGWVSAAPPEFGAGDWHLFRDDRMIGPAVRCDRGRILLPDVAEPEAGVSASRFHLVAGRVMPLIGPYQHRGGLMWSTPMPGLAELGDTSAAPTRSPVFIFERGDQLAYPHTEHKVIAEFGGGRFSHWGATVYFSTLEGEDPNEAKDHLVLFVPAGAEPS